MALVVALSTLIAACGGGDDRGALTDLQLVGVDFELNSIILTNQGADEVRTEGLWVYQDGASSEFNIFIIEPRTEILFSVRDLGGLDQTGGEIALFASDSFDDPESVLEYVAWGDSGHDALEVAVQAGRWNEEGTVESDQDTVVIIRADPNLVGPEAWTPSDVLP